MDIAPQQVGPFDLVSVLVLHALVLAALLAAHREPPPLSAAAPIMGQIIQAPAASPAPARAKPASAAPLAMRTPPRPPQPVAPSKPAPRAKRPSAALAAKAEPRPLTTTAARAAREVAPAPTPMPQPTPAPPERTESPVPAAPSPPRKFTPAPSAPAPAAAATTAAAAGTASATAAAAPTTAPQRAAGSTGNPADNRAYFAALLQRLNRFKVYPAALRKEKVEGRVVLKFTIDAQGSVVGSSIERSSGHADLDHAAERMLTRASPLPAIPTSMGKRSLTLSVPIEYSLLTDH